MYYLLFLVVGIFSVSYLPQLPSIWLTLTLLCASFLLVFFRHFCLALLLLGFTYGSFYGCWINSAQLPLSLSGETFFIEGVILGIPSSKGGKQAQKVNKFYVKVHTITPENKDIDVLLSQNMVGKTIGLSWYSKPLKNKKIKAGGYWRLKVKLKRPRGFVNPAGFDYQLYLLQHNIMATGYVKKSHQNYFVDDRCHWLFIDCWRNNLHHYFSSLYQDHSMLGPLLGLLIGERTLITANQWDTVKETGTVHLFAISGLHVGLAALFGVFSGYFFLRVYQLLFNGYLNWLPSVLSILFSVVYSCLAGLSLPTQRALMVIITLHVLKIFYRKVDAWFFISVALFGIALLDPLSIRSQGFWLSFIAVAVLLWSFSGYVNRVEISGFKKILVWLRNVFKSQWVIAIGLFLPSIMLLQGLSISSPIVNFFAAPIVSFIVVPLLFVSLLLLPLSEGYSQVVSDLALVSLEWLFTLLYFFQKHTVGFWYFNGGELTLAVMILSIIGVVGLLAPKGIPIKGACLVCFLPVFFPVKNQSPLQVTFLDVGQGTAVVIETDNHQLVYDTGQRFSDRFDTGKHIVAPYLMRRGYRSIDRVIVSHGDSDHAGGLTGLRSIIGVDQQLSGEPDKTTGVQCQSGQKWRWDDVDFTVLWPTKAYLEEYAVAGNSNNLSCVLLIQYGDKSLLLAGDIEKEAETQLLAGGQLPSSIDILLVPHHGSRTSSHPQWVSQLKPDYAIVTAGYRNAYGHPHSMVKHRYQQAGSILFNTGEEGAIRFLASSKDKPWQIERWRVAFRRYWHD